MAATRNRDGKTCNAKGRFQRKTLVGANVFLEIIKKPLVFVLYFLMSIQHLIVRVLSGANHWKKHFETRKATAAPPNNHQGQIAATMLLISISKQNNTSTKQTFKKTINDE